MSTDNTIYLNEYQKRKKYQKRKARFFFNTLIFIILILSIGYMLLFTSLFNIKQVEVKGNKNLTSEAIINISGIKIDENIFRFHYFKAKDAIKANPYIEKISINRKLPNRVVISVQERRPAALFSFLGNYLVIENRGIVLDVIKDVNRYDVPIIEGIKFKSFEAGKILNVNSNDTDKFTMALDILNYIDVYNVENYIDEVDMNNPDRIMLLGNGGNLQFILSDGKNLEEKFKMILEVIQKQKEEWGNDIKPRGVVDLSVDKKAYFKMK